MQRIPDELLSEVSGGGIRKTVLKTTAKLALGAVALTTAAGTKFGYDVYCECEKRTQQGGATAFGRLAERIYDKLTETNSGFVYRTPYERLVYKTANFVFDEAYRIYINYNNPSISASEEE